MRVRAEHWEVLLRLCEEHPELITNKFNGVDGKAKGHILWENIALKLNSLGYGEKTKEDWRRALIDWKSKTKARAAKIRNEMQKTGGGTPNYIPLSDLEKKLLELLGSKAIEGDNVQELGFGKVKYQHEKTVGATSVLPPVGSPAPADHNYHQKLNLPSTSKEVNTDASACTPAKKRLLLDGSGSPYKRVRHVETQRLSKKLVDINQESLQQLQNISENTKSIADSLKCMVDILKKHFAP